MCTERFCLPTILGNRLNCLKLLPRFYQTLPTNLEPEILKSIWVKCLKIRRACGAFSRIKFRKIADGTIKLRVSTKAAYQLFRFCLQHRWKLCFLVQQFCRKIWETVVVVRETLQNFRNYHFLRNDRSHQKIWETFSGAYQVGKTGNARRFRFWFQLF